MAKAEIKRPQRFYKTSCESLPPLNFELDRTPEEVVQETTSLPEYWEFKYKIHWSKYVVTTKIVK